MDIILYEPENPGNIGAVARVMGNFGFSNLVIVNPQCDWKGKEAMDRAKHARHILEKAIVAGPERLDAYGCLIGTTSVLGTDYNISRSPLVPSDLPRAIMHHEAKDVGLLFGPEGEGLRNTELEHCDILITIPTAATYASMNLSHAVAVVLYEIKKIELETPIRQRFPIMNTVTRRILDTTVNDLVDAMYFRKQSMASTQKRVWKRVIGQATLTAREGAAIIGFFKYWLHEATLKRKSVEEKKKGK